MSTIADRVREMVERLPEPLQQQVLEYAQRLSQNVPLRGIPLAEFEKHAGLLSAEDADAILQAIEAGCEQVDPDEW
ncbi:MAG: hypothetical protein WHS44_08060 [Fimbriimonadales bacterium]|nr:MAG: hypothetical protein KatS3mg018_0441 [Fimbriimonadales bacterium]